MLVEVYFVLCMKLPMVHYVESKIAPIKRSLVHKHVTNTGKAGILILFVMGAKDYKAFVESYKDQEKTYLGYLKVSLSMDFLSLRNIIQLTI